VNKKSTFNQTRAGLKFTLAHELCHILFDRTRAKKLSHVSGPWTAPRIEKRANAFAAMFLASRAATRSVFHEYGKDGTKDAAQALQLGHSAFVEHLYNLGLIDEADREQLRLKTNA
jgi:Zn-dependent peptidase ImmA (M78 family)